MAKTPATELFSKRLEELTERVRDVDRTKSNPKQAEEMNVPYSNFYKYLTNNGECPITYLKRIAQYYGVSTDYLLGLTDIQTTDTDIQAICNYTGLSEKAIKRLCEGKGTYKAFLLNRLLESENMVIMGAD